MQSYDISHLPQSVHDAVLHLMETLVQAWPAPAAGPSPEAPRVPQGPPSLDRVYLRGPAVEHTGSQPPPVTALPIRDALPVPTHARCPHGTPTMPCCAACATVHTAEAVLVDVQTEGAQPRFPRRTVELRVLEALQALFPMPATPLQVAAMVAVPHLEVRTILQALAMLETIGHPHKGYYRHRTHGDGIQPSARFSSQISALCAPRTSQAPRLPSTGTCGDVSPHEGGAHV